MPNRHIGNMTQRTYFVIEHKVPKKSYSLWNNFQHGLLKKFIQNNYLLTRISQVAEPFDTVYEQTADLHLLRQYVCRWHQWHHSGLRGLTARSISFIWVWTYVILD